ncbi:LCP family protein [Nocardiopsis sp. CNT312]|uniref:LCP family protein n=1 Tax=Nocardiopsis sp. CNT312 TaxID=1137268 RepID=UPI00350EDBD5
MPRPWHGTAPVHRVPPPAHSPPRPRRGLARPPPYPGPPALTAVRTHGGCLMSDDHSSTGRESANIPVDLPRQRGLWHRIALWAAGCLAVVLVAAVGTAYGYYLLLRSGMIQHDLDAALGSKNRPEKLNDAVNVLFMGTDGYEEGSTAYTRDFEGERSDALMLAHISPGGEHVSVISFPRDSLVRLPSCPPYGKAEGSEAYEGMINAAMYHGGPPCVVHTVETLTGIRVDHFVHLSFMSFRDTVNAIGGVRMCLPRPMRDERSGLDLPAGEQVLDGDEALSFVRARYEIGNGSDIGRIDRQQMFLSALAEQLRSSGALTDPARLNEILRSVAEHSATDQRLTLDRMLSIGFSLSDVDLADIEFRTVPWYQAPQDPNRVMWDGEEAAALFAAVREDRPLPAPGPEGAGTPSPPASSVPDDGMSGAEDAPTASAGEARDATSDPCVDGLGFGTGRGY